MKRGRVITLFFVGIFLLFAALVVAPPLPTDYVLASNHTGIQTTNGTANLTEGTLVGGNYANSINLTENTTLHIEDEGWKVFGADTQINCDHEPGYPDPCETL